MDRAPSLCPRPALGWPLAALGAAAAACAGPSLAVTGDGPIFVDGQRLHGPVVPFRYYGTVTVDAMPGDLPDGRADWTRSVGRTTATVPVPAPTWLFPLDLPIEALAHLFSGSDDQHLAVTPPTAPEVVVQGFTPDLDALRDRAAAARIQR